MSDDKTVKKPRGRPFPPGNRANPLGRPPAAFSLTEALREAGKELHEARFGKKTMNGSNAQLVAARLWALARGGNVQAIRLLYDRCDGLPKATIEMAPHLDIKIEYVDPEDGPQTANNGVTE